MIKLSSERYWQIGFWVLLAALLAVCSYFIIHNAWWILGDEEIVVSHVGRGIPFSHKGFPVAPMQGRFYPFAYNLYNVLLLFNSDYNTPQDVYVLHAMALTIFAIFFALIGLHILWKNKAIWKYSITFCIVVIAIFRVFREFMTCYTGVWIIFLILPIFLYCTLKFDETENWGYGILAVLSINYVIYCYENVCVIPFAIGVCSLLFNRGNMSVSKKIYNVLLILGTLIFLGIWGVVILPQATEFYVHDVELSMVDNGIRMFIAQKIYWLAIIALLVRCMQIVGKGFYYSVYDSLLLASLAFFVGCAFLKLNYIYYYNIGALIALTAILYYSKELLSNHWVFVLFAFLVMFTGRNLPSSIRDNQKERVDSKVNFMYLTDMSKKMNIYWYTPHYDNPSAYYALHRDCQYNRVVAFVNWIDNRNDFKLIKMQGFDDTKKGIWLFPNENARLFYDYSCPLNSNYQVYAVRGINGYIVR